MAKFVKFESSEKVETKAIFRNLPGWKFDEGLWINPQLTNSEFKLPSALDINTAVVPEEYFKSGVVLEKDLELEEVNFREDIGSLHWMPAVRAGNFFSRKQRGFLHGSESIMACLGEERDENGFSVLNLAKRPSLNSSLVVSDLRRDLNSLTILRGREWLQVPKFTGLAVNGRELDTLEDSSVVNQDHYEFKAESVPSSLVENLDIFEGVNLEEEDDVWTVTLDDSPVMWWGVRFSRPDIFQNELSYEEWLARKNNPLHPTPIENGDYAIGYRGTWAEGNGIKLYSTESYQDFGTVTYKPNEETIIRFNQDAIYTEELTLENPIGETVFYLEKFPMLDNSYYTGGFLGDDVDLDTVSTVVTVGGDVWNRVSELASGDPDDEIYELDTLLGIITFGDGGITKNGKAPTEEIVISYKVAPLIQYDSVPLALYQEENEDLDPHVNAVKNGFLVLDSRRLLPHRIYLEATRPLSPRENGTCCVGPLQVPPSSFEDTVILKARVVARATPERGVPNIPVEFESLRGLVGFSQNNAVTDGEGWAYTEAYGRSDLANFIITNHVYESTPVEGNPEPSDLDLETPPWGSHLLSPTEMIFGEAFNGNIEEVYMLIQSMPAEGSLTDYSGIPLGLGLYPEPYNPITRRGGLTVVWSEENAGAQEVQHPISATTHPGNPNWTIFEFDNPIPTGHLIVGYKLVINRTDEVLAKTVEDPLLLSNQIKICLELSPAARGQWKLPNLEEDLAVDWLVNPPEEANLDSSMIGAAVYMSPNDFLVTGIEFTGGAATAQANVGNSIDIIGENFPTTEELYLSVFIVKIAVQEGTPIPSIVSIKDISDSVAFIDSTTIRIASLPIPPTEEYDVNYWIAVGNFNPIEDDYSTRPTARILEIGEAP